MTIGYDIVLDVLVQLAKEHGRDTVRYACKRFLQLRNPGVEPTKRRAIPRRWVREAYARQGGRCAYCDEQDLRRMTGDHAIPLAQGGAHDLNNIVAACKRCNSMKGARTPLEFAKSRGKIVEQRRMS